jgi:predicted alpha/beta hydrolase family esterase
LFKARRIAGFFVVALSENAVIHNAGSVAHALGQKNIAVRFGPFAQMVLGVLIVSVTAVEQPQQLPARVQQLLGLRLRG